MAEVMHRWGAECIWFVQLRDPARLDLSLRAPSASMRRRAMLSFGGILGSSSARKKRASLISFPSTTMSPRSHCAVKAIVNEFGNGHGCEPK